MEEKKNKRPIKLSGFLRYGRSDMPGQERNRFERELQKDPFAEEANEGFSSLAPGEAEDDIKELQQRLSRKIKGNRRIVFYRVAASIAVLMVLSTVYITIFRNQKRDMEEKITVSPSVFEIPDRKPVYENIVTDNLQEMKSSDKKLQSASEERIEPVSQNNIAGVKIEGKKEELPVTADLTVKEEPARQTEPVIQTDTRMLEAAGAPASKQANAPGYLSARGRTETEPDQSKKAADSGPGIKTELTGAALPEGGIEKYEEYINNSINDLSIKNEVNRDTIIIRFTVDNKGETGNYTVTGISDAKYSKQLISMIKNGPAWYPAEKKGILAETEIRITFR